jgi:hypothetical protein
LTKKRPKDTQKITGYCPCGIRAFETNEGFVEVEYCRTHVGHRLEVKYLKLPQVTRDFIIEKLKEKTPTDDIIAECKARFPRPETVTRKTIYNTAKLSGLEVVKKNMRGVNKKTGGKAKVYNARKLAPIEAELNRETQT